MQPSNSIPPCTKEKSLLPGNEAQRKAITFGEGPMLVLAGPGSGKTFVIIKRLLYLIKECGVRPEEILVITFSKAAAWELQNRFHSEMSTQHQSVCFGTFHSIFFSILKETYHYSVQNIITGEEQLRYLKNVILREKLPFVRNGDVDTETLHTLLSKISLKKNCCIDFQTDSSANEEEKLLNKICKLYQEELEWHKKIDYDDMLLQCYRLFKNNKQIRNLWQRRFRYLLIDEFQDINPLQYEVVKILSEPENNLFVVGDDDQAIYGFRGAEPEIILNFPQEYSIETPIQLERNYRSHKEIVETAEQIITENQKRFSKKVTSMKGEGGQVSMKGFPTEQAEEEFIIRMLKEEAQKGNEKECALLVRNNYEGKRWAEVLKKAGISVKGQKKKPSFAETEEVKDIIAYLRLGTGIVSREDFLRIMNKPLRYIRREAIWEGIPNQSSILAYYKDNLRMQETVRLLFLQLKQLGRMPPFLAVRYIRSGIGYDLYLKENKIGTEAVDALLQLAGRYTRISEFLEELENNKKKPQKGDETEEKGVSVMTYHASKGLEFSKVFLPGLNEGRVPYGKNLTEKELEEERRVFYVAVTRAQKMLFLSYIDNSIELRNSSSRFIKGFIRTSV